MWIVKKKSNEINENIINRGAFINQIVQFKKKNRV